MLVDLGRDMSVYNDLKLNQVERVAHVLNDRLLTLLKAFAAPVTGVGEIGGLKIEMIIPHKSFLDQSALAKDDRLELYAPVESVAHFADDAITSQQLVEESVVLVNGNRTNVPLQ